MTIFKSRNATIKALLKVYFTANNADHFEAALPWQKIHHSSTHCSLIEKVLFYSDNHLCTDDEQEEIQSSHTLNGSIIDNFYKTEKGYINTIKKLVRTLPNHAETLQAILDDMEDSDDETDPDPASEAVLEAVEAEAVENQKEQTFLICLDIAQSGIEIQRLRAAQKDKGYREFREKMIQKYLSKRSRLLDQITIEDAEFHAERVKKHLIYLPL